MKTALLASTALLAAAVSPARAADPLKIGVIAENSAISGIAIPNAAQIAADEINAKGGVDGRQIQLVMYDDHNSAADAVRALQRSPTRTRSPPWLPPTPARWPWHSSPGAAGSRCPPSRRVRPATNSASASTPTTST